MIKVMTEKDMITLRGVLAAEAIIRMPADGSVANLQARRKAAEYLLNAAASFEALAAKNPKSAPAQYLTDRAKAFRLTALQV